MDIPPLTVNDPKAPGYVPPYEAKEPFEWTLLCKSVVKFSDPTLGVICPRVCPNAASLAQGGAVATTTPPLDSFVSLFVVNNDTLQIVPTALGELLPQEYVPNSKGYTVLAVACAPVPLPDFKFTLRTISTPEWPLPGDPSHT